MANEQQQAKHTSGPWVRHGCYIYRAGTDGKRTGNAIANTRATEFVTPEEEEANADLLAAAPDLLKELQRLTDNAEQSAFEEWLAIARPSGDVEQVQSQWKSSSAQEDFYEEWKGALAAIAKAGSAS